MRNVRLDWLAVRGLVPPLKTADYYRREVRRITRAVYYGAMSPDEALERLAPLVERQLTQGYRRGVQDVRDDDDLERLGLLAGLLALLGNERQRLYQYLVDVAQAGAEGTPLTGLLARADLWAARYGDAVNRGRLDGAPEGTNLVWQYGDTEHCDTCLTLNGKVAPAHVWRASGYRPQSPPNPDLECGGWRCQCELVPTDAEPNWDGRL